MSEWIPISERLPEKEGRNLVVVNNDFYSPKVADFRGGTEWDIFYVFHYPPKKYEVTHWAPLPEMPKKKRWMPKEGDYFSWINDSGEIFGTIYREGSFDQKAMKNVFGIYRSLDEAEAMVHKIRKFVESEIGEA